MDKPAILLEAVELLYLYVNNKSLDNIKRYYFLTHASCWDEKNRAFFQDYFTALDDIMSQCVQDVDQEDPRVQYFFRCLKGSDGKDWRCLGKIMAHSFFDGTSSLLEDDCGSYDKEVEVCLNQYREFAKDNFAHYEILEITDMGMSYMPIQDNKATLSQQIARLDIPSACKWEVFQMLENYEALLQELQELMRPVVQRLNVLLEHYDIIYQYIVNYWENYLEKHTFSHLIKDVFGMDSKGENTYAAQIVWPWWMGFGQYYYDMGASGESVSLGFGVRIERFPRVSGYVKETLPNILRFFSDSVKLEIIYKLSEHSYYGLELANQLGLSSGTMSKYLNSLYNFGLVNLHRVNNRVYYKADIAAVQLLIDQLKTSLLSPKAGEQGSPI